MSSTGDANQAPRRRATPVIAISLIAVCVAVFLWSGLGQSEPRLAPLLIASTPARGWSDVLSGQIWRLVTPVFIHFSLLHIIFNMYWMWGIGALVELKISRGFLLGFVVFIGAFSNVAQYLLSGNPFFGGMSGVIYGLLGYIWIQGQLNPRFGRYLSTPNVILLMAWFVLCWVGVLGAIANWAHTAGLLGGLAWGGLHALAARRRQP